jgi:hypothetical protein
MMDELITKSQQMATMLSDEIQRAHKTSNHQIDKRSRAENALTECLADCLELSRKLESKLRQLGGE